MLTPDIFILMSSSSLDLHVVVGEADLVPPRIHSAHPDMVRFDRLGLSPQVKVVHLHHILRGGRLGEIDSRRASTVI